MALDSKAPKPKTMTVEQLIEKLENCDPSAKVAILGAGDTAWCLREAIDDDNGAWVMLDPGDRLPDPVVES